MMNKMDNEDKKDFENDALINTDLKNRIKNILFTWQMMRQVVWYTMSDHKEGSAVIEDYL